MDPLEVLQASDEGQRGPVGGPSDRLGTGIGLQAGAKVADDGMNVDTGLAVIHTASLAEMGKEGTAAVVAAAVAVGGN